MKDLVKEAEQALGKVLKQKVSIPMKLYFPVVSTGVLCTACCLGGALTAGSIELFHKGKITKKTILGAVGAVCTVTMGLGGTILYLHGDSFAKPIQDVSDAAQKVADGDFTAKVPDNQDAVVVTEYEDLSKNFNKMTDQLNGMDYMRKDFMSNVSHEFKTPIAAISGFCELLEDDNVSPDEQKEYLGIIKEESERLSHLCGNMLRMSRLDNTTILTRKEPVKVDEQLRRAVILLDEKYPDRAEDISVELEPMTLETDPDLLEQIWINLLDNAVKYSDPGDAIRVTAKHEGPILVISISDDGLGIDSEKQKHIFDKFYQGDASHKKEGNGLGLSIVKRIVELLNGTITCESKDGKGSTFTVRI